MVKYGTLGYLRDGDKYLLGKKKYGGAEGKLNGFGGKMEDFDKSPVQALIREFKEETDVTIRNPKLKGSLVFQDGGNKHVIYVYEIEEYEGIPKESSEMTVDWYNFQDIDLKEMWPNDQVWFGLLKLPFKFIVVFSPPNVNDYNTSIKIQLLEKLNENTYKKYT